MLSTMMDVPLTVTGLMRYGTTVFGDSEVVTCTTDGVRRQSYAQTGARAAQLAGALRGLGVDGDQRVATLLWNNSEHLEAYLAVPSMGAVLHTLNLRLDPKQLSYIANHAGDYVVITEPTLVPLLAAILPSLETVRHIVLAGPVSGEGAADAGALAGPATRCTTTRSCWLPSRPSSTGPSWTSGPRRPCATPAAPPACRRAWCTATVPSTCTRWVPAWATPSR